MRWLLTVQYLGTRYAGWQIQHNARTVQEVLERSLERLCRQPVRLHGAGRTDAGVHAFAQTAHADVPIAIDARGIILGLNGMLPDDIRVTHAAPVSDDFHARFDAISKTYVYRIWNDRVTDVFRAPTHAHVFQPLHVDRMRSAAGPLLGNHDFRSFTVARPEVSSTRRTIHRLRIDNDRSRIRIEISADGFLRFMVRRIVGSLIEVGRGNLSEAALGEALEPRFGVARWTAPAHGLMLVRIDYAPISEPVFT